MNVKEQLKAIVVHNPVVPLDKDEICFFQANSQYGRRVEQIKTTTKPGIGIGVGVPITDHFGIGIGKRKVKTTTSKELVWEKTKSVVLLTSDRFLYKIGQKVCQISFDTVQDIKINKDAITIVSNGNPYYFFMKNSDVQRFVSVWGLIGEANKEGIDTKDLL